MHAEIERLKATISDLNALNDEQSTEIARLKEALESLEAVNSPLSVSDSSSLSGTGDLLSANVSGSQRRSLDFGRGGIAIMGKRGWRGF